MIDDSIRAALAASIERFQNSERIKQEAERAAMLIGPKLKGLQVVTNGLRYEITDVSYSYDGTFRAHGYRILANGKRGSQRWDIGFICAQHFDDAAEAAHHG